MKTLILGGARSGKSNYAQKLALASKKQIIYIATAQAKDIEMQKRIALHQTNRPKSWQVVEEPIFLANALKTANTMNTLTIVDCLTMWLTNLLLTNRKTFKKELSGFLKSINDFNNDLILISNETGMGIVPDDPLSRSFRDEIGFLHQALAKKCDNVLFIIAGLPHTLKG